MEDDLGAGLRRMRLWLVTGSFLLSRMADGSELELEGVFVSVMIFYPNPSASLKCLRTPSIVLLVKCTKIFSFVGLNDIWVCTWGETPAVKYVNK